MKAENVRGSPSGLRQNDMAKVEPQYPMWGERGRNRHSTWIFFPRAWDETRQQRQGQEGLCAGTGTSSGSTDRWLGGGTVAQTPESVHLEAASMAGWLAAVRLVYRTSGKLNISLGIRPPSLQPSFVFRLSSLPFAF